MILQGTGPLEILNYLELQPTDDVAALLVVADTSLMRRIAAEEYAKANPPQAEVAKRRGRPPKTVGASLPTNPAEVGEDGGLRCDDDADCGLYSKDVK